MTDTVTNEADGLTAPNPAATRPEPVSNPALTAVEPSSNLGLKPVGDRGFTLTEIMVVIFIIGLLSTVVAFNVLGARADASVKTARTNITQLSAALEQYSLDMYDYPSQQQGLEALIRQPDQLAAGASYRPGGYINRLPNDPWGRPFVYARPGTRSGKPFDIYTLGADGLPGGEGPDADIGNWD